MQLTGGSRFAMQTKSKIQLLTQLAGSCSPLSVPPTARHSASSCCMCANMWLIAGLCQKCRSTKTLAAVSLPTRHTHQTLPVAVTMCHFKASCLCSPSLYIFICLSSPVSVCCLCEFRLNCRTELQQTQTSDPTGCQPNSGAALSSVCFAPAPAATLCHRLCTAPLPCRFNDIWGFYAGTMC